MSEESKNVKEARELLSHLSEWPNSIPDIKHALFADAVERERDSPFFGCTSHVADLYGRAPELLAALCDEVEQLRSLNQTQAESIVEFQREQRAFFALTQAAEVAEQRLADNERWWNQEEVKAELPEPYKQAFTARARMTREALDLLRTAMLGTN